ncbi:hypothetical protein OROGR_003428 [Orobanche gracilis]
MMPHKLLILSPLILLLIPPPATAGRSCRDSQPRHHPNNTSSGPALKFKLVAIGSVLAAGAVGVSLPILGRKLPALRPENDTFFMIKAFAAGVILATGFVHILPDAFDTLTSPCLGENP